ncbi:MAG: MFS transporter [Candidatus Heimdallarchaeaceae archaeon]
MKILKKEDNFIARLKSFLVNRLYLNDRRRLSIILIGMVGSFPMIIFMSYVGLHLEDIHTMVWLIGLILAFRNIYQIFLRVPLGHFSQMVGRKPLLIAGIGFYTLSLFVMALSTHWSIVLVAVTFLAIGMSCFWPILFAYIGDIEENNIGQLQGRVFQGTDLGVILGSLLAVLLLKQFQVELRVLFAWGAGISLVGVIGMVFFMPEVLRKEDRLQVDSKIKALLESFVSMFRNLVNVTKQKKLSFIYLVQLLIAFLEYMVTAFFPFLVVSKGYPDDVVAQVFWISAGVLIFFKPFLGKIIDKIGYRMPMLFTILISSSMLVLMTFVDSFAWLVVVYIIYSGSSLTSYIGVNTGTTVESKTAQRGMALGALGFYVSFSRSITTFSLTPIWNTHGIDWVFRSTAIIISSAVIVTYLIYYLIGIRNDKNNNQKISPL